METEVLAPAGSLEGLKAALYAGADAVYTGGRMFGARAYASNLSDEELTACIEYCHLHKKKLYLTVNTLMKPQELPELVRWLTPFYEAGLDAVIVQDLGALSLLKQEFPELDLHASTQMSIHSADGAKQIERLGAVRVVPAREISLEEIAKIRRETALEIECFVHGALCYSYSGQCLMSSMIGGRSGNRGRCAQPCRLPYRYENGPEQFYLSPKDICTLEILPDILEAGVDSLKIEGRMKRTEYTAGVSAMYRKYVDLYKKKGREYYQVDRQDIQELMDLYNRGGFSTGYYRRYNGISMMSVKRQNHYGTEGAVLLEAKKSGQASFRALETLYAGDMLESATLTADVKKGKIFSLKLRDAKKQKQGTVFHRTYCAPLMKRLEETYTGKTLYEKIKGKLMILEGKPAILSVTYTGPDGTYEVSREGAAVQTAQNQPIQEERIRRQMLKTGNSSYAFEKLDIVLKGSCFLPMQSINELRRLALEELDQRRLAPYKRRYAQREHTGTSAAAAQNDKNTTAAKRNRLVVSVEDLSLLESLTEITEIERIYLDSKCFLSLENCDCIRQMAGKCRAKNKELWYVFPHLFREKDALRWEAQMKDLLACFDGVLVKNPEQIACLQRQDYKGAWASDYNVYSFNQDAKSLLKKLGADFTVCPAELNFKELQKRGCAGDELLIYGRIPVMTSVQCLQKTAGRCTKQPGLHSLQDRLGNVFPVKNCCTQCYNVIYNTVPVSLHGMSQEVKKLAAGTLRLAFTTETKEEAAGIVNGFVKEYVYGDGTYQPGYAFTRGHYKRGVE